MKIKFFPEYMAISWYLIKQDISVVQYSFMFKIADGFIQDATIEIKIIDTTMVSTRRTQWCKRPAQGFKIYNS